MLARRNDEFPMAEPHLNALLGGITVDLSARFKVRRDTRIHTIDGDLIALGTILIIRNREG